MSIDHTVEPTVVLPFQYESLYMEANRILSAHADLLNDIVVDLNTADAAISALTTALAAKISFRFSTTGLVKATGAEELVTSVTTVGTGAVMVLATAASNGAGIPIFISVRDGVGLFGVLRSQTAIVVVNGTGNLIWFAASSAASYSLTATGAIGDQIVNVRLLTMNVQP